jgi:hypothetical protein
LALLAEAGRSAKGGVRPLARETWLGVSDNTQNPPEVLSRFMQGAKAETLWGKTARQGNSLSQRQAVWAQRRTP